ncbi:MAG: GntR family transcriptional regulator [Brevinema sp.]
MKKILYQEIYNILKLKLLSSPQVSILPSERNLAKEYNTSRVTIRHALDLLTKEGLIHKNARSASVIRDGVFKHSLINAQSLKEEFEAININYQVKILTFKKIKVNNKIASILEIKEEDLVFYVERLISINNKASIFEYSYLPYGLFSDLTKEDLIVKYDYIEKTKNLQIKYIHKTIKATIPSQEVTQSLNLQNHVTLLISVVMELSNGKIGEYVEQYFSDEHIFTISSYRN